MYKYEEPSLFSGTRGAALIAVILLHVVIVWAFYTGLAGKLVQKIIPPVEIAQIDKPKDVDKPPPPPPKLEEIKPYVPPPEFVDIQAPPQETNAITQITQTKRRRRAGGRAAAGTARHAAADGSEASAQDRRGLVSGRLEARQRRRPLHRAGDGRRGRQHHERIDSDRARGFPRLDEACLKGVHGQRMMPATEDGKPVEKTVSRCRSSGSSRTSSRMNRTARVSLDYNYY